PARTAGRWARRGATRAARGTPWGDWGRAAQPGGAGPPVFSGTRAWRPWCKTPSEGGGGIGRGSSTSRPFETDRILTNPRAGTEDVAVRPPQRPNRRAPRGGWRSGSAWDRHAQAGGR